MPEHKTTRATPRPETQREKEGEVDSPGKTLVGVASAASARSLPGQLAWRQQSMQPLSLRGSYAILQPRLRRRLRGGMQIFVKIINTQDQMRIRRRRPSARSS